MQPLTLGNDTTLDIISLLRDFRQLPFQRILGGFLVLQLTSRLIDAGLSVLELVTRVIEASRVFLQLEPVLGALPFQTLVRGLDLGQALKQVLLQVLQRGRLGGQTDQLAAQIVQPVFRRLHLAAASTYLL